MVEGGREGWIARCDSAMVDGGFWDVTVSEVVGLVPQGFVGSTWGGGSGNPLFVTTAVCFFQLVFDPSGPCLGGGNVSGAQGRNCAQEQGKAGFTMAMTTEIQGFSGSQVCALVGITYRQLDYWARTGLLEPSVATAKGSGTKRRYSYHDVLELKVIKQLLDAGLSLQRARQAVDCLRANLGADLGSASLILSGTSSVLAADQGEIVDLLAGGQGVFNVIPMAGLVSELEASILNFTTAEDLETDRARPARTA